MDVKIVDHEEQCFNINRAIRSCIIENHKQLKEDVGSKGLQYIWMKEPSCGIHILITMCRIPLRTENSMQRQSSGKEMLKIVHSSVQREVLHYVTYGFVYSCKEYKQVRKWVEKKLDGESRGSHFKKFHFYYIYCLTEIFNQL